MKLKDIVPYCLGSSKKPFTTSFNPLYFWVIGGFTYSIDSFESYCPPEIPLILIHRFDTFELAQKWVDEDKQLIQGRKNCQKIRLLECAEV